MRSLAALCFGLLVSAAACGKGGSGNSTGPGSAGDAQAGATGDTAGAGNDAQGGAGDVGNGGTAVAAAGEATGGSSSSSGSGGTSSTQSVLYVPPAVIIGGPCQGTPAPATPACSDPPEQVYCRLDDPSQVIMAVCSAAGRSQCEVMSECEPGWHACTATDYVARGGRDVPPSFSSNTDRAWLAACVRDASGTKLKNEPCSVCGSDVGFPPSIQWWCDGSVVYEGGMEGDTLGIVAAPECMRVGANAASHGAFWTMSFSDGAPSFVMCCSD